MARYDQSQEAREVRQAPLDGGINDQSEETLLPPNISPFAQNVEFNRGNVETTRGAVKFNNQVAPGAALLTKCDPGLSPIPLLSAPLAGTGNGLTGIVEVPARGAVFFPYSSVSDIGGQFTSEGSFLAGTETFHTRRGRSFEFDVSFRLPDTEKLYEAPTNGSAAPATPALPMIPPHGFDEALDECFCIIQKGGDGLTPMSWALAVVNVGAGVGLSSLPAQRPSNYALVFMWYDAPGWGETSITSMKYNLGSGTVAAGQFCTQAMRAVLIHKYVEPGVDYSVAVNLSMDTGTPANVGGSSSAWNADGSFKVFVSENREEFTSYTYVDTATPATSGMEIIRGPVDSLSYLCRYGIRYAGKDARWGGMGNRFTPWMKCGFVPFGADLAPLRSGGFSMVDRSSTAVATLYGASTHTLTAQHTSGDAYVVVNLQALQDANIGLDPKGEAVTFASWQGLNAYPNCNTNALRGYRLVTTADWAANRRGAILSLLDYVESGASYRFNIYDGANTAAFGTFTAAGQSVLVQCFRWHQRPVVVGQFRTWTLPRAYDSADALLNGRRGISLRSSIVLDDTTEPDLGNLQEYYRCDDAGGAVVRELVAGGSRNGFLYPLGNAVSEDSVTGEKSLFLSGAGEALTLDLSEDPTFARELGKMLAGSSQGFGFQVSFTPLEAQYALPVSEALPDNPSALANGLRPKLVPDLVCWDVKDSAALGTRAVPRPLLVLGHRGLMTSADARPFRKPFAYTVEVGHRSDQENVDMVAPQALQPWWRDSGAGSHNRYDFTAPWVGRRVTMQVGVQSTGSADVYDVYIALTPKDAFLPENGDPSDCEMQWWTDSEANTTNSLVYEKNYFKAAHLTIKRKDLERSVLTVGGRWNCKGKPGDSANLGVSELNARMLVHEVRWFAASPPGALATYSAAVAKSTSRNGKLEGTNVLPQLPLTSDDMLRPLGANVESVILTSGSATVTPSGSTTFYIDSPYTSVRSVLGSMMMVSGDTYLYGQDQTVKVEKKDYYWVSSVSATGSSLTLATPYAKPSRNGAIARCFTVIGYTRFEDDVRDRPLLLGRGQGYNLTTTTVSDVVLTDGLWANKAPNEGSWKLRIYNPFGGQAAAELLPSWTRGLVTERRIVDDGILGLHGFNERIYAGVRGNLYELDDRWRYDGPTDAIPYSLQFRSRNLVANVTTGEANDRVVYQTALSYASYDSRGGDTTISVFDTWVNIDDIDEFQTIAWAGDPTTNPTLDAGSTGNRIHYILRLNRGRPEFCFGSTAQYSGSLVPEKGLYAATAQQSLQPGRWTHIRWYIYTRLSGTVVLKPYCKINGKRVEVRVNATDKNVLGTNDWLTQNTIVLAGSNGKLVIGCGRDGYRAPDTNLAFSSSAFQGTLTKPQRLSGWMHSLNGRLAQVVYTRQLVTNSTEPADFDPFEISYDAAGVNLAFLMVCDTPPVGHRIPDQTGVDTGVIYSHPFVSVFHEMGTSNAPFEFTDYGDQVHVVNGGKPVVVLPSGVAKFTGVPSPISAPKFTTTRFPLWAKNARTSNSDANDPIAAAAAGASQQTYHYSTVGNTYWRQALTASEATAMAWSANGYFYLKFYVRPRRTNGRIQLWRKGSGANSGGPFLECVDGKVRFGWYDTDLKEDVYVTSTDAVFDPGRLHYVFVKKRWPTNDAVEGNWESSMWSNNKLRRATFTSGITGTFAIGETVNFTAGGGTAGSGVVTKTYGASASTMEFILGATGNPGATSVYTGATSGATGTTSVAAPIPVHDMLIVRQFRYFAESGSFNEMFVQVNSAGGPRCCTSLTADSYGLPSNTNGTGMVTPAGLTFTGGTTGFVVCASPANHVAFHRSMVGMYWIWGGSAGATWLGRRYRITGLTDAAGLSVTTDTAVGIQCAAVESGDSINFSTIIGQVGAVFWGIALKKSTNFDASKSPDKSVNRVEFMGTGDQGGKLSGFMPFDGDCYTPGWGIVTPGTAGVAAATFETASSVDPTYTGTDDFKYENYDTTGQPDALQFEAGKQVGQWDGRAYGGSAPATSQPNTALAIRRTNPAISSTSSDGEPVWTYNQAPDEWTAPRYIGVILYDADQDVEGNPGPLLELRPTAEDSTNPSGAVRTTITNLPVGTGNVEVWVYASAANGSSGALFRVAKVANGTVSVPIQVSEIDTTFGPALEFTNSQPPRCGIVRALSAYMLYGALESEPTAIVPSRPGRPAQVDFSKLFRFPGGAGDAITGLYELDGLGVMTKRRALGSFTLDGNSNAIVGQVSGGVGAVANQTLVAKDNLLFFFSDAGIQVVFRQGVTNLGRPQFVGDSLNTFVHEQLDKKRLNRCSGAVSRDRNTYVVVAKKADDTQSATRISVQMDEGEQPRFAFYRNPNLTCIASVQDKGGGIERLIGGTEEGFGVYLDDPVTQLVMLGEDPRVWGQTNLSVSTGPTTVGFDVGSGGSSIVDTYLEGPRGVVARYTDSTGVEREVTCLGAQGAYVHFSEVAPAAPVLDGTVVLAGNEAVWTTAWIDMGNPRVDKVLRDTTLVFRSEPFGSVELTLYADQDTDMAVETQTIDLSQKYTNVPWTGFGRRFKLRVRTLPSVAKTTFALASIVWRVMDQTQEGGG